MRFLIFFTIAVSLLLGDPSRATAQNGRLIEDLFRTWAGSQLEKERQKRAEAEARAAAETRRVEPRRQDPYRVELPSGFGRPTRLPDSRIPEGRRPPDRPSVTAAPTAPINVRSREAADYAGQLVRFSQDYHQLIDELRGLAHSNASVSALLPDAYEVDATCDVLVSRLDGLSSLATMRSSHQILDQRYRNVSFQMRSISGLNRRCRDLISSCDRSSSQMCRMMGLEPQMDRLALRDLMITAATYMQALIDDLEVVGDRGQHRSLQHDCRLLRQRLVAASRGVGDMSYEECVTRFSDFVNDWDGFADRVYAIHNPYLSRRLDRISQCGDQTYGLLWMPPPTSMKQLGSITHRLHYDLQEVAKSLTFFSMSSLRPAEQNQLTTAMRELIDRAKNLEDRSIQGAGIAELRKRFLDLDQTWCAVHPTLARIPSLHAGRLASAEQSFRQLREGLNVAADAATPVPLTELVSVAAALEGTSEHLKKALDEYDRYLQPSSYRNQVTDAARDFHRHSREVHELLSRTERLGDRRHLEKLREECGHLLQDWERLSRATRELSQRGLSGHRVAKIRALEQTLIPLVGQIGAALGPR